MIAPDLRAAKELLTAIRFLQREDSELSFDQAFELIKEQVSITQAREKEDRFNSLMQEMATTAAKIAGMDNDPFTPPHPQAQA